MPDMRFTALNVAGGAPTPFVLKIQYVSPSDHAVAHLHLTTASSA